MNGNFGRDMRAFKVAYFTCLGVSIALFIAIVAVAVHFVAKYW